MTSPPQPPNPPSPPFRNWQIWLRTFFWHSCKLFRWENFLCVQVLVLTELLVSKTSLPLHFRPQSFCAYGFRIVMVFFSKIGKKKHFVYRGEILTPSANYKNIYNKITKINKICLLIKWNYNKDVNYGLFSQFYSHTISANYQI